MRIGSGRISPRWVASRSHSKATARASSRQVVFSVSSDPSLRVDGLASAATPTTKAPKPTTKLPTLLSLSAVSRRRSVPPESKKRNAVNAATKAATDIHRQARPSNRGTGRLCRTTCILSRHHVAARAVWSQLSESSTTLSKHALCRGACHGHCRFRLYRGSRRRAKRGARRLGSPALDLRPAAGGRPAARAYGPTSVVLRRPCPIMWSVLWIWSAALTCPPSARTDAATP